MKLLKKTMMIALIAGLLIAQAAVAERSPVAGTYTGVGNGRNGEVSVNVTVDDAGAITDVSIGENQETPAIAHYAFDILPGQIVEHQTLQLDAVSGATLSSFAVKNAVKDALEQAGLDPQNYQTPIEYEAHEETIDTGIVIVGAGGHSYGPANAQRTAALYDGLHPTMVNTSMLTVVPGTPLYRAMEKGLYTESTEMEKLEEILELVRCLTNDTIFMNEHASNLFHVQCRLPEGREELLTYIQKFMEGSDEKELRKYRERITCAF